jgi:hypothetical protein
MIMSKRRNFKKINVPVDVDVASLTPLEISCGSTKCEENLHCFSLKRTSIRKFGQVGKCKHCGEDLIDWDRIRKNNIKDAKFIFDSLKKELFRHVIWHMKINQTALKKASEKNDDELRIHVKSILQKRLINPFQDGRQTPVNGNEITNYAQHATATCCRKCIEVWHDIPEDATISNEQMDFFTDLALLFIEEKVGEYKSLEK